MLTHIVLICTAKSFKIGFKSLSLINTENYFFKNPQLHEAVTCRILYIMKITQDKFASKHTQDYHFSQILNIFESKFSGYSADVLFLACSFANLPAWFLARHCHEGVQTCDLWFSDLIGGYRRAIVGLIAVLLVAQCLEN